MPEQVKLWRVREGDRLDPVNAEALDFEERLEAWIADDITVLQADLLVIGRQVPTDYGGFIDLLCLDQHGDCVIVELKRGLTPREVTAQALDYASCVSGLSGERIVEIANAFLGDRGPLEQAFSSRFRTELPQVLNAEHGIIVVGSQIDASTERIIRYLSGVHGVGINAVTFQHFRTPTGDELVSRLVLMEQQTGGTTSGSKRRPNLTYEELEDIAGQNGVGPLYERMVSALTRCGRFVRQTTLSSIAFAGDLDRSRKTLFSLLPAKSAEGRGLHFQVYTERMRKFTGLSDDALEAILPVDREPWTYFGTDPDVSGCAGFFRDANECDRFLHGIGLG